MKGATTLTISSTEGRDEHGKECWDVFEVDPLDCIVEDGDSTMKRIARYRTREEAAAFIDGLNWPALKAELWKVRFAAAFKEDEGEPAEVRWEGGTASA